MRLTKRQLKRIIREEYSKLKRRGLIRESQPDFMSMYYNADDVHGALEPIWGTDILNQVWDDAASGSLPGGIVFKDGGGHQPDIMGGAYGQWLEWTKAYSQNAHPRMGDEQALEALESLPKEQALPRDAIEVEYGPEDEDYGPEGKTPNDAIRF